MISQSRLALLFVVLAGVAACAASSKPLPPLDVDSRGEVPDFGATTGSFADSAIAPQTPKDADAVAVTTVDNDAGDAARSDAAAGDSGRPDAAAGDASKVDAN